MIARTLSVVALSWLAASPVQSGQDAPAVAGIAGIVRTERAEAGLIRIVYDLRGAAGSLYTVSIEASNDGGRTFTITPRAVTGDIGPGVSAGAAKAITWDSSKDVEDLQLDRYVFRVLVSPASTTAASPAGSNSPPARGRSGGTAGAAPGRGGAATGASKKGGLPKGALIAIAGGGAAAGVGVAVSKGGGTTPSSSSPAPSAPPTSTSRNVSGPYSVAFTMRVANPNGSDPCMHDVAYTGTLSLILQIIGGSVTGNATLQGTVTNGASTCIGPSGRPGPTPGETGNASAANVPVTGTPASLSFSRQLTTSGVSVEGVPVTGTLTFVFGGVVNPDNVTGELTISARDESANSRIGFGSATVSVTLR